MMLKGEEDATMGSDGITSVIASRMKKKTKTHRVYNELDKQMLE